VAEPDDAAQLVGIGRQHDQFRARFFHRVAVTFVDTQPGGGIDEPKVADYVFEPATKLA
jgi:hypothetical protein